MPTTGVLTDKGADQGADLAALMAEIWGLAQILPTSDMTQAPRSAEELCEVDAEIEAGFDNMPF